MSHNLTLITISGKDSPGITASIMDCIRNSKAQIQDMGQSITHGLLSLSILLNMSKEDENSNLLKELLFSANELGMNFEHRKIENAEYVSNDGDKYILSCVATDKITPSFVFDISNTLAKHNMNILRIENITNDDFKSLDIATIANDKMTNWKDVKAELIQVSNEHSIDLALLKDNVWRRNKRLIVFDMDSTLIQSEVIVEMAKIHGVGQKVHDITERAMNGEFDFDESLIQRVSYLEGLEESKLIDLAKKIKLTDGVADFIKTVKSLGYKVAIISGGFQFFANYFKEQLGLDYAFANDLDIQDGLLTGKVNGTIVNAEKKALLVDMIAQQENINLEQVVAIGDGANDLKMLSKAGLGIAFHAKDIVKKNAGQHMSHGPMDSILYFLGIPGAKEY
ncbi:MAG: phosphoserine phosphatase SerB [Bacteriovoracaceae bacterium]|jgi:phosphoserine phosphatase|nr:phosphoserine phosphatase SerB [Bacteriovoracaceae bacterium]